MSLLDVLRGVMLDPAEQAVYDADPGAYLEQYGYQDVNPADLSEAFGLVADTLPVEVARAAWTGESGPEAPALGDDTADFDDSGADPATGGLGDETLVGVGQDGPDTHDAGDRHDIGDEGDTVLSFGEGDSGEADDGLGDDALFGASAMAGAADAAGLDDLDADDAAFGASTTGADDELPGGLDNDADVDELDGLDDVDDTGDLAEIDGLGPVSEAPDDLDIGSF